MKKLLSRSIAKLYGLYFNIAVLFSPVSIAKKAFTVFCSPRKGKVQPEQKAFLCSAKDRILENNAIRIQTYLWPNQGPTVLLMHGWESNSFRWRKFILKLKEKGFNIIAFDAPAHGYSTGQSCSIPAYKEATQKVIETYKPNFVIGHSIGGMTMIYNQSESINSKIEKMVSLAAPSELSDLMRQYKKVLGLSKTTMKHIEAYTMRTYNFTFANFSSPKFARDLAVKGLLIHDVLDKVTSAASSQEVHENWTDSILFKTTGYGHSLGDDAVHKQVIDFLRS